MAERNGWRRLILVSVLMLAALPAMAGERPSGKRVERSGVSATWRAVVRWVAPSGWLTKLGPGMDPNGVTAGTVPAGGSGASARSGGGELGPEMDPNG
ncbi:MAG: hypothetical protein ABI163_18415 [Thermoanaerobaculia bacterium]